MRHENFCVIYSGSIVQADVLKCLLEGEGINALLEDEFIGMIAPYVSPGGAGLDRHLSWRRAPSLLW